MSLQRRNVLVASLLLLLMGLFNTAAHEPIGLISNEPSVVDSTSLLRKLEGAIDVSGFPGDPICPCLQDDNNLSDAAETRDSTYGMGCGAHNVLDEECTVPEAPSWCQRAWCWVNHSNCGLLNNKGANNRYYSYATCRNVDFFANEERIKSLNGRTIRIALNHNSGGWRGAYSSTGNHFEGPLSNWRGPVTSFVKVAAEAANFNLEVTPIPDFLREPSRKFFNSSSQLDLCIYAASLGFVDLCVGSYAISSYRSTTADFLVLGSHNYKLVVKEDFFLDSDWSQYSESIKTIFKPFERSTWIFVILFVIPIMGCLVVVHELAVPGSVYSRDETVLDSHLDTRGEPTVEVRTRRIPLWKHFARSVYVSFLSTMQGSYEQPIVSLGGRVNLIGIGFFILGIVAVYTANLAAILTSDIQFGQPQSLAEIIDRGQRICATRNTMNSIMAVHNIEEAFFVVDPVEEGGDGLPGFVCTRCGARRRIFDFLDPDLAKREPNGPEAKYCHAAIAAKEELDVLQSQGVHCNKTFVGSTLSGLDWGVPMFSGVSAGLQTLMLSLKNQAALSVILLDSEPKDQCVGLKLTAGDQTSALNIRQLSGIWVVSFGFAFVALLVTCLAPVFKKAWRRQKGSHVHVLSRYDQLGQRISRDQDGASALEQTLHSDRYFLERSKHSDYGSSRYSISHNSLSDDSGSIDQDGKRRKRKHQEIRSRTREQARSARLSRSTRARVRRTLKSNMFFIQQGKKPGPKRQTGGKQTQQDLADHLVESSNPRQVP